MDNIKTGKYLEVVIFVFVLFGLYLVTLYNYLLFHGLVEIFTIVIGFSIFMITWTSRRMIDNNYLRFIGIAFLFISFIDLVHTFGYKGMGVFQGSGGNLSTALWIVARYLQAISLLIAPLMIRRKMRAHVWFIGYSIVISLLLGSIFVWNVFPVTYIEGVGLTPFKVNSEYIISLMLLGSIFLLVRKRKVFSSNVYRLLIASIIVTILSELAFTFYISVYGLSNTLGHFFKLIEFYLIYKAIIQTGIVKPYDLIFRDLKHNEAELIKSNKIMNEQNIRLKRLDKMKSRFISTATHELRTPLTSIKGYTELIRSGRIGKVPKKIDELFKVVERNADRLSKLTDDLLDQQRIESGRLEITSEPLQLQELIEEVVQEFQPFISKKNQVLNVQISADLSEVMVDRTRVGQVIINLLSNASKFTSSSGKISIKARESDGMVEVQVSDNGIGIAKEDISKLFEPFPDIPKPSITESSVGLGLSICKGIIRLHGGKIWAESEGKDEGATFTFTIPKKEKTRDR